MKKREEVKEDGTENEKLLRRDLRILQTKMNNPKSSDNYHLLRERMLQFMRETKRSWGHAVVYLLELGLEADKLKNSNQLIIKKEDILY
jgi:hypothetical protein